MQKELNALPLVGKTDSNYQRKTVQNYELPDHNVTFLIDSIPRKANYGAFNEKLIRSEDHLSASTERRNKHRTRK